MDTDWYVILSAKIVKERFMKKIWLLIVMSALLSAMVRPVFAENKPMDTMVLEGVTSGKVVWDINTASPAKLALYLGIIQETYDDLVRQGISPSMVLTFRGQSLRIISTEHEEISVQSIPEIEQSARMIHALNQRNGIRMEACSIAARIVEVDTGKILDGIRPVGNTFVSLIGYQSKGYAIIPIY
jgi:intracellular sulfur oxidation DsrE/DsrF family protein